MPRVFALIGWSVCLAVFSPAQEQPPRKPDPKSAQRTLDEARKEAMKRKILVEIPQPVVRWPRLGQPAFRRPWIGPGRMRIEPTSNATPAQRGELKRVLQGFDDLRLTLYSESDPKQARAILDRLELQLVDIRRVLFALKQAPVVVTAGLPFGITTGVSPWSIEVVPRITLRGHVRIGTKWLRMTDNPLLVGAYAKSLADLNRTRGRIQAEPSLTALKPLVDHLTRDLSAVRRGLWVARKPRRR